MIEDIDKMLWSKFMSIKKLLKYVGKWMVKFFAMGNDVLTHLF